MASSRDPNNYGQAFDEIFSKATTRLFRQAAREDYVPEMPSSYSSHVVSRNTIVLRNSHRELARYRFKRDSLGRLRLAECRRQERRA